MAEETVPSTKAGLGLLAPASVYVAIRLVSQGIVLGASLLLAMMLPIEAFAAIGTAFLIQAMLVPLSGFALHGGLERLFFTYGEDLRRGKILTIFLVSLTINALVSALAYVIFTTVLPLEFVTNLEVAMTLCSVLLLSVQYVPIVTMRCEGQLRHFALLQLGFVVITQAAILIAVFIRGDVEGFFYGMLTGSFAGFIIWCAWLWKRTGAVLLVPIREEIAYSAPSVPIGVLEAVQQVVDRYILQLAVPGAQFASYALALRFASPISTIAQGTKAALYPILYRIGDKRKIGAVLSDMTNLSISLFGVLVNLIVVMMAFILTVFLDEAFQQVYPIFIAIIFGVFLRVQEVFLGIGADVTMRQDKKMLTLMPVMLGQIAVAVGLTLTFGLWGAAGAYVINSAMRSFAMAILGQRLLPRRLSLLEYGAIVLSTAMPLGIYFWLAVNWDRFAGPELMLSAIPALLLVLIVRAKLRSAAPSPV